jgi:serine/threonine protein kinase
MGEFAGKFFMKQIIDALSYLHNTKSIAHRDLKLDNILIDDDLNLILADFGYATSANRPLSSYRGTKTYMAPEVKLLINDPDIIYDGKAIDVFSAGVILFVIVVGIFPFIEAKPEEPNYKLIYENNFDEYWANFDPDNVLSTEFK